MKKIIYNILLIFIVSIALSDDIIENNVYFLEPGPNLISFNVLPENTSIDDIFSPVQNNIISVISEGQISYNNNGQWVGSLTNLNHSNGYWVIADDYSLIDIEGNKNHNMTYYLENGANLISYPYSNTQSINEALPFYAFYNIVAILGQNQAALISNNQIYGSLTHFEPNKGYWFLVNDPILFEYNNSINSANNLIDNPSTNDTDINSLYNQSTSQSVFFINEAYYLNNLLSENDELIIECNNTLVGGTQWNGEFTDLIAMGNDGNEYSEGYCENMQNISVKIKNNDLEFDDLYIIGNNEWYNNNISIIALSDFELADINLDDNINITDIVVLVEHIVGNTTLTNNQQLLLSDVNYDQNINITDVILIVDSIIQ